MSAVVAARQVERRCGYGIGLHAALGGSGGAGSDVEANDVLPGGGERGSGAGTRLSNASSPRYALRVLAGVAASI